MQNKTKLVSFLAIIIWIANLVIYLLYWEEFGEGMEFTVLSDLLAIFWGLFATIGFVSMAKTFDFKGKAGISWLILSIGVGLWFLGDISWGIYEIALQIDAPYPGVGDYFWLFGYIFLISGLLMQLFVVEVKSTVVEIATICCVMIFIGIIALYFVLLPIIEMPIVEDPESLDYFSVLEKTFSILYPVFDLILILLGLILIFKYRGGDYAKCWFLLSLGFMTSAIYDLFFSYYTANNIEGYDLWMDHIYLLYYMMFAIGSFYLLEKLQSIK